MANASMRMQKFAPSKIFPLYIIHDAYTVANSKQHQPLEKQVA